MANIDRPSFIAELSSVSRLSSVEKVDLYCDSLRTVLEKLQLLFYIFSA